MKYIGTLFFLSAMYWSWCLATTEQPVSQRVHLSLQDDMKKMIAEYIQQNLPNSQGLQFERFWTEALNDNRVKASFIYSFEDTNDQIGDARVQIEGYAVLNRSKETSDSIEWSFDELVILNNAVDFKEPLKVSPEGSTGQTEKGSDESHTEN